MKFCPRNAHLYGEHKASLEQQKEWCARNGGAVIDFFVGGVPVPKGSAKAFMRPGAKYPTVMQDNRDKQKPWASAIGYAAQREVQEVIQDGPISIRVGFYMPRPKGHYGTGKNVGVLKGNAPYYHTSKPDLDKLIRCVKDALTGIVWKDDSQVVMVEASKMYGEVAGARIAVSKV